VTATVATPDGPGAEVVPTPASRLRTYSTAWWGVAMVVLTEGMIFLSLIGAYFFLRASSSTWPPTGIEAPELKLSIPFTIILWSSSIPVVWAEAALRKGDVRRFRVGIAIAFVMGLSFLTYTIYEFSDLEYRWTDNAYSSIFWVIVGLHAFHVLVGLAMNLVVQLKAKLGRYDGGHHASAEVFSLYWHFVDGVWLLVFPSLFLSAHIH
jgi:heme/copper-type cytochrome/quinol oxidase subunit 3